MRQGIEGGASKMLRIDIEHLAEAAIVRVTGDADMASSTLLRNAILDLLENCSQGRVIVSMAGTTYIDSSAVASLVEGLQLATRRKVRFCLAGLNEAPLQVLRVTRLIDVFEVHSSEEDALKA